MSNQMIQQPYKNYNDTAQKEVPAPFQLPIVQSTALRFERNPTNLLRLASGLIIIALSIISICIHDVNSNAFVAFVDFSSIVNQILFIGLIFVQTHKKTVRRCDAGIAILYIAAFGTISTGFRTFYSHDIVMMCLSAVECFLNIVIFSANYSPVWMLLMCLFFL